MIDFNIAKYHEKNMRRTRKVTNSRGGVAGYIPGRGSFFKMRQKKEAFFFFCDNYLPIVVGKNKFKKQSHNTLISDLATRSDEALVYLMVENNWDRWTEMASHDPPTLFSNIPTKFTERGKKAKEFCGWNLEGLTLFNRIMTRVRKDRSSTCGKDVEKAYLEYRQEKLLGRKSRQRSSLEDENIGVIKVKNDLFPIESDDNDMDDDEEGYGDDDDSTTTTNYAGRGVGREEEGAAAGDGCSGDGVTTDSNTGMIGGGCVQDEENGDGGSSTGSTESDDERQGDSSGATGFLGKASAMLMGRLTDE